MIVPRSRLLFWVAIIFIPCGLLSAAEPRFFSFALMAPGALIILSVVDACLGQKALQDISVHLPPIVRMSKDRRGNLDVRIRNAKLRQMVLRFALVMPGEILCDQDARVLLPKEHEWSRFSWSCLPRKKGVFRINLACLEVPSPLGLWDARRQVAVCCELRAYPNLLSERKSLAALFLRRGSFGLHVQRQIGKGREFEKLREYVPGDGFEDIHWKATAKRGKPVTKVFQIERTQEVYVVIDASRLSARKSATAGDSRADKPNPAFVQETSALSAVAEPTTALDRYIAAALVLGLTAEQQGDLFGLITFSDKVDRFLRARNGKNHFSACRDALYTVEPKPVTPDYEELFTFIRLRLRRRALLVFLTALDDPLLAEGFIRNLDLVRHQHLVLVNMIRAPNLGPVFDGPLPEDVDDLYECLGGHLLWENLCELEKVLQRRGVKLSLLRNEQLSAQLVHQYLSAKRRQVL
jgi:uncharacterized protein (DUF58 family)